jgi:hypothetical protein
MPVWFLPNKPEDAGACVARPTCRSHLPAWLARWRTRLARQCRVALQSRRNNSEKEWRPMHTNQLINFQSTIILRSLALLHSSCSDSACYRQCDRSAGRSSWRSDEARGEGKMKRRKKTFLPCSCDRSTMALRLLVLLPLLSATTVAASSYCKEDGWDVIWHEDFSGSVLNARFVHR